jgi:hypothetical protein
MAVAMQSFMKADETIGTHVAPAVRNADASQ